jgi:hypothetical protein
MEGEGLGACLPAEASAKDGDLGLGGLVRFFVFWCRRRRWEVRWHLINKVKNYDMLAGIERLLSLAGVRWRIAVVGCKVF